MKELELADRYIRMNQVVELYLEGKNETQIGKALSMKRVEVMEYVEEFKEIARSDDALRDRMREVPHEFDIQQGRVISEMWELTRDPATDNKTKAGILKNIADVTAKRVEVLQKSGLLSDSILGDEMAAQEEKIEAVMAILREVSAKCDHCKIEVAKRLARIENKAEPIVVQEVDLDAEC